MLRNREELSLWLLSGFPFPCFEAGQTASFARRYRDGLRRGSGVRTLCI